MRGLCVREVAHVISIGHHMDDPFVNELKAKNVLEISAEPIADEVIASLAMTKRLWDAGTEIWFHCEYGRARSPSFAFAMLVMYGGEDILAEAYKATHDTKYARSANAKVLGVTYNDKFLKQTIALLPESEGKETLAPYFSGEKVGTEHYNLKCLRRH